MLAMISSISSSDGNWFSQAKEENFLFINLVIAFLVILIAFTAVYVLKTL